VTTRLSYGTVTPDLAEERLCPLELVVGQVHMHWVSIRRYEAELFTGKHMSEAFKSYLHDPSCLARVKCRACAR
jgi:hypothetical protein